MLKNLKILLFSGIFFFSAFTYAYSLMVLPKVIENEKQAYQVLDKCEDMLSNFLGMGFKHKIIIKMGSGEDLDKLIKDSPYKKNVTGLYTFENGNHVINMMKNVGLDEFFGTMCHELTHAWQTENCPGQSQVLKEGTAVWVEYKCLYWDGAYAKANDLNKIADPVYGVGYRYVQELENKYGDKNVLKEIMKLTDIPKK